MIIRVLRKWQKCIINKSSILYNAKPRKNIWALKIYVKVFTIKHWSLRLKSTLKIDIKICYVITFWRKAYAIEYCQNLTFQYVIRALFIVYRRRLAWNRFWNDEVVSYFILGSRAPCQGHFYRTISLTYCWIVICWDVKGLVCLFFIRNMTLSFIVSDFVIGSKGPVFILLL